MFYGTDRESLTALAGINESNKKLYITQLYDMRAIDLRDLPWMPWKLPTSQNEEHKNIHQAARRGIMYVSMFYRLVRMQYQTSVFCANLTL